jgi:hypothetical protein
MSMDYTEDDEQQQPRMATLPRKEVRRLEKLAAEGKEAKEQLEQLKKERAYVQAGVPLDDKRTPYFMAGYQGEMTPEAIRAKWNEDFGPSSAEHGNAEMDDELRRISGAQDLVSTGSADLSDSRLAERNAKLAELSMSDPRYPEKFEAIFQEYGGQQAAQSNIGRL